MLKSLQPLNFSVSSLAMAMMHTNKQTSTKMGMIAIETIKIKPQKQEIVSKNERNTISTNLLITGWKHKGITNSTQISAITG